MATQWTRDPRSRFAIAIGINQYAFCQPLGYAMQDAVAVRQYLIEAAGFPADQCFLLTDHSPAIEGQSTQPTREILQTWIEELCYKRLRPGDLVWVFVSGRGLCEQGEDYLLPMDGDPNRVQETGISLRWLYEGLQAAMVDTALVLLDISREGTIATTEPLGQDTVNLAFQSGVATLLSCQPGEVTHESSALRQGFFTSVLLQGLKAQHGTTIGHLYQYLAAAMPLLNQQHRREAGPHPILVVSHPHQFHQSILPQEIRVGALAGSGLGSTADLLPLEDRDIHQQGIISPVTVPLDSDATDWSVKNTWAAPVVSLPNQPQTAAGVAVEPLLYNSVMSFISNPRFTQVSSEPIATEVLSSVETEREPEATALDPTNRPQARVDEGGDSRSPNLTDEDSSIPFPEKVGGKVQIKNGVARTAVMAADQPEAVPVPPITNTPPADPPELSPEEAVLWQRLIFWGGLIAAALFVGALVRNGAVFLGQTPAQPTAPVTNPSPAVTRPSPTGKPRSPQSQVIPAPVATARPSPTVTPVPTQPLTAPAVSSQQQANQALLNEARILIRSNQVSQLGQAIDRVSQIKPGQPLYDQAQELTQRWSQVILDTAEGRALQGDPQGAIAAARLIPASQPALYARAQDWIAQWRKMPPKPKATQPQLPKTTKAAMIAVQKTATTTAPDPLTQAKNLIEVGSASSYNRAIAIARQIKPSDPNYPEARQFIAQWSRTILTLAENRANRGKYYIAIQTAKLVTPDTPAYPAAQKALAQWSQDILSLARERASQNRLRTAIRTARLIPPDTPAYPAAQRAIAGWQRRLGTR